MAFSLVHFAIIFELLEVHMQIFHAEKHIWALFNTATRPVLQALQVSPSKAKLSVTDFSHQYLGIYHGFMNKTAPV